MYLHLGQDYVVHTRDIIGIFDIESSSVAKNTRQFLLPKSFVVTDFPVQTVFISPISARTLQRRCERIENMDQYQRGGAL